MITALYEDVFAYAVFVAAQAHRGQVDKQGEPYLLHVLRVALAQPDALHRTVGVLHDVVEDTYITLDSLRAMFGEPIATIVGYLTRHEGEPYTDYIDRLKTDPVATRVKYADLEDNLNSRRGPIPESLRRRYAKARTVLLQSGNWNCGSVDSYVRT